MIFLIVAALLLYPYMKPHNPQLEKAAAALPTSIALTAVAVAPTLLYATVEAAYTSTPSPMPTFTPTSTEPFYQIFPTSVPVSVFKLSFYDPEIGDFFPEIADVNCMKWNRETSTCESLLSNGDPFVIWYGRGVACPPGIRKGSIIRVSYPLQLAGDWTCIDRGYEIVNGYLDFLLKYPDDIWSGYDLSAFPWSDSVQAQVIQP